VSESVVGLTARPAPVQGIALPPQASESGLIPLGVPWQRILDAFLNTALDSPASVLAYRRQCAHALLRMGVTSLTELSGELLGQYRAEVVGNPNLAPSSQAQALDTLRSFLKWAGGFGAHGLDDRVIAKSLRSPTVHVLDPHRILDADETARLWEVAARSPKVYALFCLCFGAGLRRAEIAALRTKDCHEDLDGGPAIQIRHGKGGRDRIVPMLPAHFAGIVAYVEATRRTLHSPGMLFVASDRAAGSRAQAERMSPAGIAWLIKTALTEAGIDTHRRGAHAFRHLYADAVLRNGGNLVAVQKLLGHAHLMATETYVNHQSLADLRAALPGYVPTGAPRPRPTFAPPCPPPVGDEPTLTSAEVSVILGVGPWEIRYLWRKGHLAGVKVSGVLRFDPATVEAYRMSVRAPTTRKVGT
jgi:integrase/recombinase XerC